MAGAAEDCLPLVAETLGGWHKLAIMEIKRLTAAKARHTSQEEKEALNHAFTRLSILLMKGNSAILLNCLPMRQDAVVDGEM